MSGCAVKGGIYWGLMRHGCDMDVTQSLDDLKKDWDFYTIEVCFYVI